MTTFKALQVTETPDGQFPRQIIQRHIDDLPAGEVLIKVVHAALNYKDALSATGNKGITRTYPHTPGVDAAGVVITSQDENITVGESVIVTGYDLGMNTSGAFAEYIRVPAEWVVKLPNSLTLKQSMIYGTAGFTAAWSIYRLQQSGLRPEDGEVLVTGATGGVGCLGVALLAKLGYRVVAGTGKPEATEFLYSIGAQEVLGREALQDTSKRALLKGRWAGVLDTVGGNILETAIRSCQYGGHVSCCGLVASNELHLPIYPFILRGVSLLGVDSAARPMDMRLKLWDLMANDWRVNSNVLQEILIDATLEELNEVYIDKILQGKVRGHVVVTL
jgi:acrylyl-CoA reductase (NADPH)